MKTMKRHWPIVAVLLLTVINITVSLINTARSPRIAYVRSQELVYGYFGMKEAMTSFQQKQSVWKMTTDSLTSNLESGIVELRSTALTDSERRTKEESLRKQQEDLGRYNDAVVSKMQQEEKKTLEGVLSQVNSFVEQYAKKHGYDMIMGTTEAGSLLYGTTAMDVTDDLLLALNQDHEGMHE